MGHFRFGSAERRWLLAAVAGLWAGAAPAAEVTQFTLENGLQVLVIEDHRAPVVTQSLWYRVGAADDVPGHSGIAHFLEHLMFKGTPTVPAGDFSARVAADGGNDNAFTGQDSTQFTQRVAADRLELVMRMEADRMRNLALTEADVATERDVVLEERSSRVDSDPGSLLGEQMQAALFLNHPYARPIIGWRHEIERLDRDDALTFYRRFYAPNNAFLIIAGDVDAARVRVLAETYYGPIAPTPDLPERVRPSEPPQLAERRLTLTDPAVQQPYVHRTYLAPARNHADQDGAAALTVLAALLGGSSTTSVLGRALMQESATAIYVAADYNGTTLDDGTFDLIVVPAEGVSLDEAEAAMDAAIWRFLEDGVDEAALTRIRTQVRAAAIYRRDNVDGLAEGYGSALSIGLTVEDVEAWPGILQAVTADQVMAAARSVFDRRQSVTGHLEALEAP